MSISSWWAAAKAPRKAILLTSILLWFASLGAITLKAISDQAWRHPRGGWSPRQYGQDTPFFTLDVPGLKGRPYDDVPPVDIEFAPLLKHNGYALIYATSTYGLLIALITMLIVLHFASTQKRINPAMGFTYLFCHLTYAFPLALFVYLTVAHARSEVFSDSSVANPNEPCVGMCKGYDTYGWVSASGGKIDMETWTCGLSRSSRVKDPSGTLQKICTGEAGSRVMMAVLTAVGLALAVLLEVDRRWAKERLSRKIDLRDGADSEGATV